MKKIGVFGGTFNPIHNGHLDIAEAAYDKFDLDFIYFIPTGYSYHKKAYKEVLPEDRFNMVKIAIENFNYFKIGDFDIKRKGPTYTVDTIKDIKKVEGNAEYYLILGSDAFLSILKWKDIKIISNEVYFLVAERLDESKEHLNDFIENLPEYIKDKTFTYYCDPTEISSEEIRKGKMDPLKIPKGVYDYILEKRLYY